MKRKQKIVLLVVLPLLAVLIAGLIFVGTGKKSKQAQLKVLADNVDVEIKDVLYTEVGSNDVKWEVRAAAARYVKEKNLALFEDVKVNLLLANGTTINMSGDKGEFRTDTKDMTVSGHVRVVTDRGEVFTTDRLCYSNAAQSITAEGPITIESGNMRITGSGFKLDLGKRQASLRHNVKARIG